MDNMKAKKRSKSKYIIIIVALIIISAIVYFAFNFFKPKQMEAAVSINALTLQKGTIMETISTSGAIYSATKENIYSTLSYPIKEVLVEVGDEVKTGDILAILDMSSVDYQVKQAENDLTSAEITATEDSKTLTNNISTAEISVETSKISLEKQQSNYNILQKEYNDETAEALINAKNSVDSAFNNLESAKKEAETKSQAFESNKVLYDSGIISKSELDTSETSLTNANETRDNAQLSYNQALDSSTRAKETLKQQLETAKRDLDNAELNYKSAQNSLTQARAKGTTTDISLDNKKISLEKLQEDLGNDKILATTDGTITETSASVGSNPSGILFVIEDTNDLYVSANVYEYDLANIPLEQRANVTTDATGNKVFGGNVNFISPKAVSAAGSTTVEFETRVGILEQDPLLKIGMNAFLDIVVAQKDNVYSAPYSAVITNPAHQSVVYAIENNIVVEIPVETGLETSSNVEISGDNLTDGMSIVLNPTAVTVGQKIDPSSIKQGMKFSFSSDSNKTEDGEQSGEGLPSGGVMMPAGGGGGMIKRATEMKR